MADDIPCARLVFAQMDKSVLNAIKSISITAKTGLLTLKTEAQARALSLDISLVPLQLKRAALDLILKDARSKTQIIPTEMVLQCPQLGAINTTFESALVGQLEGIANIIFDIDRMTSIKVDITAQILQFDLGIEFLDSITATIDEVLGA